jgi:hypothetical protein
VRHGTGVAIFIIALAGRTEKQWITFGKVF